MKKATSLSLQLRGLSRETVAGRTVAIVGGTGGIGRALTHELASFGAQVVVVGQTFRDADVANIRFIQADLSMLSEARRAAELLPAESIELLVFTTGIFAAPTRQATVEGIERDMAVSYLSRLVMLDALAGRLGQGLPALPHKPRVFIMGYPGSGQAGTLGDLNAERTYRAMAVHMNTVAGNEMLVLDSVSRHSHLNVFGLNPGLIKTNIRSNLLGRKKLLFAALEGIIGWLKPTADDYAKLIAPLFFESQLEPLSGSLFNSKAELILPSPGLTPAHMAAFLAESWQLVRRAQQSLSV